MTKEELEEFKLEMRGHMDEPWLVKQLVLHRIALSLCHAQYQEESTIASCQMGTLWLVDEVKAEKIDKWLAEAAEQMGDDNGY